MPFHVYEGSGDPGFTPRAAGLHYTNYTNGDIYLSNGYASSADWILIGTTASIASAITTHAALVSSVHGITAAAAAVLDDATVAAMVDTLGGAASTGTNGLVRATSPTLVTPVLGVASATSIFCNDNGSSSAPSFRCGSGASVNGWYSFAGIQLNAVVNGFNIFGIRSLGIFVDGNFAFGGSADVVLERIAANHLGLSNASSAQAFSVYNVAGTDYERGVMDWQTTVGVLTIGTQKGGAGVARAVQFSVGSTSIAKFETTGHLLWNTDNTYDIGASGATRPRDLFLAGSIKTGSTTLHKTSVALTNGAAAAAGTLLNAPAAGNPTKWIPIDDNGTTRYIPAW